MNTLLLDNNDSFTYNLVDLMRSFKNVKMEVVVPDRFEATDLSKYDRMIISPGPGKPNDFPAIREVIRFCEKQQVPLLGICLGHQAISEYFGAELYRLTEVIHGQKKKINIRNSFKLFEGLHDQIEVGLYHSWAVKMNGLPNCLQVAGTMDSSILMAIQHKQLPMYGIQFHPESFLTPSGKSIMANFIA